MKLIRRDLLDEFIQKHAETRTSIASWVLEVEKATWKAPRDIKDRYSTASFLAGNVVIFNVKGNAYRLEVMVAYRVGMVMVKWVGTHAEYSKR